jgi:uncharacterized protein (TIGR02453 family)
MATEAFHGFPKAARDFYAGLEADNTKAYWQAHKTVFEESVRAPMATLLESLPERYGPFHVFRPYRDVRFSRDKSPYKEQHGAVSQTEAGGGHYLHVSADGVLVAAGMYTMARDQLTRFRAAIADDMTGVRLEELLAQLRKAKTEVHAHDEPLHTAPRGYSADHPRIELLCWKGCLASTQITSETVVTSGRLPGRLVAAWERMQPMVDWLEEHVGPTTEPLARRR